MSPIIPEIVLSDLTSQHQTPFYIYCKRTLTQTVEEIKQAFPIDNFQLLFATMANDNREFLETIFANNIGACVNSIKHFQLVVDCGVPIDKIQFTSTGLPISDMNILSKYGIALNIDSLNQLKAWIGISGNNKAGIRINTKSLTDKIPVSDRLGMNTKQALEALEIAKSYNKSINGLHIYVGTNYKNHTEMMPALVEFFSLAIGFPDLEYVNIGGGIGINYLDEDSDFDIRAYGESIKTLIETLRVKTKKNIKLFFEPGRRLAAPSGWFVTKVTDIKHLNSLKYAVVDASVSIFPRPFHHPEAPHKAIAPFKKEGKNFEETIIVGKTTFSKDILGKSMLPKNLLTGDIILFDYAGAYCDSMRSRFLGQKEPAIIFLES